MKLNLKVVYVVAKENPETGKHKAHTYFAVDEKQAKEFFTEDHSGSISFMVTLGNTEVEVDYEHYVEYYQPYYERRRAMRNAVH